MDTRTFEGKVQIRRNKCFKEDFAGFERLKPINIIIGRNNSGKSALLDMVAYLLSDTSKANTILDNASELLFTKILSKKTLEYIFPKDVSGGIIGGYHWTIGSQLVECQMEFRITNGQKIPTVQLLENHPHNPRWDQGFVKKICDHIAQRIDNDYISDCLVKKKYRRLTAERDIVPEKQNDTLALEDNGTGAANLIRAFLHVDGLDRDIIRVNLLESLNRIFQPDNLFMEIASRYLKDSDTWEIFLNEKKKGLIPLSKSGSGLKTILLVLFNLLVVPKIPSTLTDTKNFVFAFEELENNLHPSLLRRLYYFIEEFAEEKQALFFITTHSNTVIDFFNNSDVAQIVHVMHDGDHAITETVSNFIGQNTILDDLWVRASDLLQANGIVWLEGPSDRIYFNKWIEIYSKGTLREHRDYECAFYGGAVLAQHQATEPNDVGDFINIFRVNRNAILLADSDRRDETSPLKQRVTRIQEQIQATKGLIWVFEAKEIENYVPEKSIQQAYKKQNALPRIGRYHSFQKYLNRNKIVKGKFDKVGFAKKIMPFLSEETLSSSFDLPEWMERICSTISGWQTQSDKLIEESYQ